LRPTAVNAICSFFVFSEENTLNDPLVSICPWKESLLKSHIIVTSARAMPSAATMSPSSLHVTMV
jgi:hypothetical protein